MTYRPMSPRAMYPPEDTEVEPRPLISGPPSSAWHGLAQSPHTSSARACGPGLRSPQGLAQEAPSGLSVESYQGASAAGPGDWGSRCRMDGPFPPQRQQGSLSLPRAPPPPFLGPRLGSLEFPRPLSPPPGLTVLGSPGRARRFEVEPPPGPRGSPPPPQRPETQPFGVVGLRGWLRSGAEARGSAGLAPAGGVTSSPGGPGEARRVQPPPPRPSFQFRGARHCHGAWVRGLRRRWEALGLRRSSPETRPETSRDTARLTQKPRAPPRESQPLSFLHLLQHCF
ncbi:proline-rich protein HaeIII subfamily 1-like [Cervus elaphus]|uniref:proline-rich protein HaeIII subfamily 1-like n=1 Tax=Cervus elaphus TaxID=9860 RepID=UPI001CC27C13|nr:proline-rich protein HaeIII subfamily 1-like [Cervus elaphus]